jgi:uncharacterized protein with NAD-binding domain and iron-sulfur cluster
MRSEPIVTVNLWFHEYAGEQPLLGLPGRTFQWVFARRKLILSRRSSASGGGAPADDRQQTHLSLVSSGAESICRTPNQELVEIALHELRAAIPAVRDARLRHAQVVRERRATFSLHPGGPPRPGTVTPVRGLFLAGDWIDTGLPATIESAVDSGHRAAAHVLKVLCHPLSRITKRSR